MTQKKHSHIRGMDRRIVREDQKNARPKFTKFTQIYRRAVNPVVPPETLTGLESAPKDWLLLSLWPCPYGLVPMVLSLAVHVSYPRPNCSVAATYSLLSASLTSRVYFLLL